MTDIYIQHILEKQSPHVRALLDAIRPILRELAPELHEYGQESLGNIVYKGNKVVMTVSPYKNYVNINLYYGTQLDAPDGVLRGSGKALRYVRIESLNDIQPEVLQPLIAQSLKIDGDQ